METLEELISTLYDMISEAWSVPMAGEKCIIERDKVLDILDEIREIMPADIKMAKELVARREDYISAAIREAESMKKQAEEHSKKLVENQEILLKAKKQSIEIMNNAERKAVEIKQAAGDYCDTRMHETESLVTKTLSDIKIARGEFKKIISKIK